LIGLRSEIEKVTNLKLYFENENKNLRQLINEQNKRINESQNEKF
jgi:hypothetical protein